MATVKSVAKVGGAERRLLALEVNEDSRRPPELLVLEEARRLEVGVAMVSVDPRLVALCELSEAFCTPR